MDLIDRTALIDELVRRSSAGSKIYAIIRGLPAAHDDEAYQRGYEDGFREGRTRRELSEKQN